MAPNLVEKLSFVPASVESFASKEIVNELYVESYEKCITGNKGAGSNGYKWIIIWRNVILFLLLHLLALMGLWNILTTAKWLTRIHCE